MGPCAVRQFAAQRAQPFWDLVALIQRPAGGFGRCVDLGCGSGELTAAVTDQLGIDEMVGIDSSDAMLTAAREAVGCADDRLRFARGDVGKWTGRGDHDLVLANASLQWVPDHPGVLARWWAALAPGGQLAVQVPANADHAAHRLANQVAATEPFLSAFNSLPPPDPVAQNVLAPEQYAIVLDELGAVDQHVRLQVYPHHLESTASVVEWTTGHDPDPLHQAPRPRPRRRVRRRLPHPRARHARRRLAVLLPVQAHPDVGQEVGAPTA